ncbi:sugar transferase [Paraglaciecola hydrolytica]|uniref:Sugar transferase n=1 Tax=Paraglaciecola hydrolytica TaxID=1799789 RepID=A0A148KMK8_9ALTE|nr:sugar transferase [Paraglaciecola hydrolytica]KXI27546.1 sugar transferase [Paraglaciecola hydrolytica]
MLKRSLDILVSGLVLLLALPVLLLLALLIRLKLGSPVLFMQKRPGKDAIPFNMLKFRSMTSETDEQGELLSDERRLTRFGQWLRASSLDELPGLINVLKGDMSLVGPRPLLEDYLPLYNAKQQRRHDVRPGITGWAQVNGRNALSWEQKFIYDVWYVDNQSFWLDCKILAMTVLKVINRADISHAGEATMSRFTGSPIEADKHD